MNQRIKQSALLIYNQIIIMAKVTRIIEQHLAAIMQPYLTPNKIEGTSNPKYPTLDRHVSQYFKQHKSLGSRDRKTIYDKVYDLIRYHHYLNHLCKGSKDFEYRLQLLHSSDFYTEMGNSKLSKWIRCSFPKGLYDKIENSLGNQVETFELCKSLNTRAPTTLRINPAKITRDKFVDKLSNYLKVDLEKTTISPYGVKVPGNKNIDLYDTEQFKEGLFEVQDEASQITALQIKCKPGDLVLDYCSGSGGKSLAIAHLLEGKGQIFLHEPRAKALENAKKRFQRAGVQNVQFHSDHQTLERTLQQKIDWLILDVPCTGTGTIRRNPDIKLRFNEQSLKYHTILQQEILSKSIKFLKRDGKIVYITCSILSDENESQVRKFIKQFNLQVVENKIIKTKTIKGGMDSMFSVILQRRRN